MAVWASALVGYVFVAQIRDGHMFEQVPPQDGGLLLDGEALA